MTPLPELVLAIACAAFYFLGASRSREVRPIWHFVIGGLMLVTPITLGCILLGMKIEMPDWLGISTVFCLFAALALLAYALGLNASYKEWKRATERR